MNPQNKADEQRFLERSRPVPRIQSMPLPGSAAIRVAAFAVCFLLSLPGHAASPAGVVKVVQKTPIELEGYDITFEKLDFTFEVPVTARFWIEYDSGKSKPITMEVPHDHVLPTNHYALSYLQMADNQVSLTVATDSEAPENRRTGVLGGGDESGTRTVTYQLTSPRVDPDRDIELFRATVKPPWRRPQDPVKVTRIMVHFSRAEYPQDPIPLEDNAAWWKVTDGRPAILRRGRNSFDWKDVSPKSLASVAKADADASSWSDLVDLSAMDANEAWVAVVAKKSGQPAGWIEHTTDGGKHWQQSATPVASSVKLSFVNSSCGFLLVPGSPAAGLMDKTVYGSTDGGVHWRQLASPGAAGQSFYPTGICFRTPLDGWITATYHGAPDAPLFHTVDGGKSWQVQELEFPADFRGGYADVYPPFFYPRQINPGLKKGELAVKLVRHMPAPDREEWIYYRTEDGGATWHLPKPEAPQSDD
jgi:hypothetical protein